MTIARSLLYALANLLHPRMLWLIVWPMLISLGLWSVVALLLWARIAVWLGGVLEQWLESATFFLRLDFGGATLVAAHVLIFLFFVPLIYLTVLFILGVFGMPSMVEHVAGRAYPQLARRRGGSFAGSVANGVVALVGLVLLGVVSLPLWIFPPLWPLLPVAILGWVNQRVLRYDALAEHADAGEMARLFREQRGPLYLLGIVLALVAYVPPIGFFAPVLFGLTFIHYLLAALRELREAPIAGTSVT